VSTRDAFSFRKHTGEQLTPCRHVANEFSFFRDLQREPEPPPAGAERLPGRGIINKQQLCGWGDSVVELVAADLRMAFPDIRGFSPDSVWRMRQLYSEYYDPGFLEQAVPENRRKAIRSQSPEQVVPETQLRTVSSVHPSSAEALIIEYLAPVGRLGTSSSYRYPTASTSKPER
jgi:hypothetical protein